MAKSAPSGGGSTEPQERVYNPNATTLAAMKEASDIMSGKKKVEWHQFTPGMTEAEQLAELRRIFES